MRKEVLETLKTLSSRDFRQGETIFKEGDMPDDTMYFLLTGEIGIMKKRPEGEREINRVSPGSFFGEMALIGNRPRLASARVQSVSAKVAVLNKATFLKLCGTTPQFVLNMLQYAVSRLLAAEDKLQRIKEENKSGGF